jgi:competence protein ComEA
VDAEGAAQEVVMRGSRDHVRAWLVAGLAASLMVLAANGPAGAAPKSRSDPGVAAPVNVNLASEEELAGVRGIGKVLAKRIVDFRDEHGPFERLEDLMKVRGIGEKSFEKLRPLLTIGKKG